MCFKSKVKTPKTNPDALKAPEPVLIEEPKGVDFGASEEDQSMETGTEGLKVSKETDKGDGSSAATATDTGTSAPTGTTKKANTAPAIKRALKR